VELSVAFASQYSASSFKQHNIGMCGGGTDPTAFPRSEGRYTPRKFTDKWCAILTVIFAAGMVMCVLSGIWYGGNVKRLTHGVDWQGQICGIDAGVLDKKFMMFCGSPERTGNFPSRIIEGSTVCVDKCPVDNSIQLNCLMPAFHNFTAYTGGSIGGLDNVKTLEMTLTQSVTYQASYPTEEMGGRFCLPSGKDATGMALRELLIDGPWGQYYRPLVAVGGLMDAWPLLLIAAGLAVLFGALYLYLLLTMAGPLIFATMVMTTLFTLAGGIFFGLAVFMDMDEQNTDYTKFNPICSVYVGDEAKLYSILLGVLLTLIAFIFGAFTATSAAHIDECIGLIDAASEPFRKAGSCAVWLFPVIQGGCFILLVVATVYIGLPIVASLGRLDHSEITINGKPLQGLQQVWKKDPLQHAEFWFYLVGIVLMLEFYMQFGNYVVAYVMSCWYFTETTKEKAQQNRLLEQALGRGIGKKVAVRVAGVDTEYGPRHGTVVGEGGAKMLVVPVGKKGPGTNRNELELYTIVKPDPPSLGNCIKGAFTGITYHVGSIALGVPIIFALRPFRMVSQWVAAFLARINTYGDGSSRAPEDPHMASIKGCLSLLSACLEQVFGKYSKNAFVELVLGGGGESGNDGFLEASDIAFQRLVRSGGTIAHLHGSMLMYDIFGSLFITLLAGWTTLILQDKLDMFNEPASSYYIEDKNASAAAAMIVAFAMSFAWMSLWSQTADVLLYCVAWNRRQNFEGEEHGLEEESILEPVTKFAPQSLRYLLPEQELDSHMEHGLHAHGIGQQGAILAAMEHGAMGGDQGAPDYGKSIAQAHVMATRMVQG